MNTSENKKDLVLSAQRCSVGEMQYECDSDTFQVLKAGDDGSDPKVIYQLGMCYHYGWGTDRDLKAAVECYARAAGLGSFEALGLLLNMLSDQSIKTGLQNAFRGFCEKADQLDARAQFNAGYCHYWGIGTPEDKAKARDLFQMAADQGCADAVYMLEVFRAEGFGDGYNGMKGISLLEYVVEMGSAEAQFELGDAYYWGKTIYSLEVKQDRRQAIEWYQKAADQNHTWATHNLAYCNCNGKNIQKNVKKAFQLYRKAALMGNGYAQNIISEFYSHKRSGLSGDEYPVRIDFFEAVYWNRKAADQDNDFAPQSMSVILKSIGLAQEQIDQLKKQTNSFESAKTWYDIAKQYETGNKVERDEKKAFNMYKLAARLGSIQAKPALGRYYEQGIGTDVDTQQAIHWYEKAVMQGHNEAAKFLSNLIHPEAMSKALNTESPFAALAECYQTGSGVARNEDTALLMREYAAAEGDIEQAKIVIEAYIFGNGNEYRIKTVGSIVSKTSGLSREDYQQFINKFQDSIDELDKLRFLQHISSAIRAENMGINIIFE